MAPLQKRSLATAWRLAGVLCALLKQSLSSPLFWLYKKMLYSSGAFPNYKGIVIAEFGPVKDLDPEFVTATRDALDFLTSVDPHRYRRVAAHIKAIVKSSPSATFGGKYQRASLACVVNFESFGFETDSTRALKLYACTLVHEATHGYIDSRRFPYTCVTNRRIERICIEEEVRLSRRFGDGMLMRWETELRAKLKDGPSRYRT